ncbi:MAG TPA: hypothetical protein VKB24_03695 [Candidatus Acidoferrum sp.]|nr:hypothetical protein [Candidatus Acidoferrum sp.]
MASYPTKKAAAASLAAVAIILAILLALHFSGDSRGSARAELLGLVPPDATSVIFIDLDQLRASPFLAALSSWAPNPAEDSDYTQFVAETGFHYERDLSQVFVANRYHGPRSSTLVLAQGKFDRKKIEGYLGRNGKPSAEATGKVFRLAIKPNGQETQASLAFLSDERIAIGDSEDLREALDSAGRQGGRADWQLRFDRLAGSPLFAVIRQDPAVESLLAGQSPQLANFISQLPWISVAAKPEGDILRVVAEGETLTDTAAAQLRDFLAGMQVLARTGLDDPQLRLRMKPEEREAYVALVRQTEIEKINRSEAQAVRVILPITPEFLKIAKLARAAAAPDSADPAVPVDRRKPARQAKPAKNN